MAQITIEVPAANAMELAQREKTLKAVAALPLEDSERICKLAESKKALAGLKKHWKMLTAMFG
ncbi:hypothetical protein GR160_02875 [Flavobacterium sp. Sd200]|uniref:hypothetical protein n=1 Tax=Flavobacterium sp. Sd200 TaxID=2692211 RepID=UPI00136D8A1B|nr:hypothetical protein [Flavobacterium sp. Sd200]MXN90157.1 hypothetical protein [Flavobacterium sp. Sd200]